jgi:hypothetical protein
MESAYAVNEGRLHFLEVMNPAQLLAALPRVFPRHNPAYWKRAGIRLAARHAEAFQCG